MTHIITADIGASVRIHSTVLAFEGAVGFIVGKNVSGPWRYEVETDSGYSVPLDRSEFTVIEAA